MKDKLLAAWSALESLTPLKIDCGAYCNAACCGVDEDGQGGVTLFPGEADLLKDESWATLRKEELPYLGETDFLTCKGTCDRSMRPLGCRIFPLTPVFKKDHTLGVRIDRRAFAMCPLAGHGIKGLSPDFTQAVHEALALIATDTEGEIFLRNWARLESLYRDQSL